MDPMQAIKDTFFQECEEQLGELALFATSPRRRIQPSAPLYEHDSMLGLASTGHDIMEPSVYPNIGPEFDTRSDLFERDEVEAANDDPSDPFERSEKSQQVVAVRRQSDDQSPIDGRLHQIATVEIFRDGGEKRQTCRPQKNRLK